MRSDADILGSNIKQLRKSKDLTQVEMAKLLKIGVGSLRKLECGIIPPRMPVDVLYHAYAAFGILPSALFAEKDEIV